MKYYLALDVGGTEIKGCALDESGGVLCGPLHFPARAQEGRAEILENFFNIFRTLAARAEGTLAGAALAFPGEFDYPAGICRIHGIDKYEAIYGADLRAEFRAMLQHAGGGHADLPIVFINDVEAFALGESGGEKRLLALAIGTGAGSSFLVDGRPAPNGTPGVPRNGWVYNTPFRGRSMDDWLSRRGLMTLSQIHLGEPLDGAALAGRCAAGDAQAQAVFTAFGEMLAEAMEPFVLAFRPDTFVLGGQVTKSFALFGVPLKMLCAQHGVALRVTHETSRAAFRGLYQVLRRQEESV